MVKMTLITAPVVLAMTGASRTVMVGKTLVECE